MPTNKRFKTKYPGVIYVESRAEGSNKLERIFHIIYRKDGKLIEEKAGRQFKDNMTPAKAATIRALKIKGKLPTNKEKREAQRQRKWTISALWGKYKESNPNLKGMITDENRFQLHLKDTVGRKEPKELSPMDVDRLRINLSKDHAPQTVKNTLELLRRIINFGTKKQLIPRPALSIEMPKVNNLKTEDLTPEQISNLLTAIEEDAGNQAGGIMKLALFTGMRRGEIFRLKWTDIDFEKNFIHIRDPKGVKDQIIPLNEEAKQVILQQPRKKSEYIFPGLRGGKLVDVKKGLHKIRQAAGIPENFRPLHGLRHVYASMLASSGEVDIYTLQKLLTHKSALMTQRYAHLRDEALRKAADLAGQLVNETLKPKEEKAAEVIPFKRH
jgi:integrase